LDPKVRFLSFLTQSIYSCTDMLICVMIFAASQEKNYLKWGTYPWLEISTQWMWMLNIATAGNDFWLLSLAAMTWISSMSMLKTSYQSALGDLSTKKYINPLFFQSMVKSYGKELPTLTSIHHIRGSYQKNPRKKEAWKSGSWERITHKSTKKVIEKNVAYAVRLDITGTIVQISLWMSRLQHLLRLHQMPKLLRMWMSRLQHLLRLHQMPKLLRMHQLLKLKQFNHQGMKWRVQQHHYQHQTNHLSSLGWNYILWGGHDSNYKRLSYFFFGISDVFLEEAM